MIHTCKKLYKNIASFAVYAIIICGFTVANADEVTRTITISGSAERSILPNQITIYMRVISKDQDFNKAKEDNTKIADSVIKLAKKYGAKDDQIQSENFNVRPEYQRCNMEALTKKKCDPNEVVSYNLERKYSITLNKFELYDDFVVSALDSGLSNIDNIQFSNTEIEKIKEALQVQAATNAKEKAQAIVAPLGMKLGKPISITTENYLPNDPVLFRKDGMRAFGKTMDAAAQETNTLSIGEMKVRSDVDITFEIN